MDRRGFLRHGAFGASGMVAGDALRASERPKPARFKSLPTDDMDAYLASIDEGAARLARWPLAERFPGLNRDGVDGEDLARKAMHSLYMTGMFGDLPVEQQIHAGMQDRLWAAQETMDAAYDDMTAFLSSRTPEDLTRVRETLRADPGILHEIVSVIDAEAERASVSGPRRDQLRTVFTEAGWRLANQAPELMIDEYMGKVQKVVETDIGDAAHQRWLAAKVGEEVFWQAQESLRQRRISRGLRMMGIGVLLFAVGALLVSVASDDAGGDNDVLLFLGLVPGITGGTVLFTVGLIVLLVGASTPESAP